MRSPVMMTADSSAAVFRGDSIVHDGRTFYVSRDGKAPSHPDACRLRRLPTVEELPTIIAADGGAAARGPASTDDAMVITREYTEVEPALLMGCERFASVDETVSQSKPGSSQPDSPAGEALAHARGPELLGANEGGTPEHETLVDALEHTARTAASGCGITHLSADGAAKFESYATLLREARRMASGLLAAGLEPRTAVALQLVDSQLHLRAVWACGARRPGSQPAQAPARAGPNPSPKPLMAATER